MRLKMAYLKLLGSKFDLRLGPTRLNTNKCLNILDNNTFKTGNLEKTTMLHFDKPKCSI